MGVFDDKIPRPRKDVNKKSFLRNKKENVPFYFKCIFALADKKLKRLNCMYFGVTNPAMDRNILAENEKGVFKG